jgi:hypothetical protein
MVQFLSKKDSDVNFINIHIINKIFDELEIRRKKLNHQGYFMFDEEIKLDYLINSRASSINRVNAINAFCKNQSSPIQLRILDGKTLLEIYTKIKNNQFYIDKKMTDGKYYKVRLKK